MSNQVATRESSDLRLVIQNPKIQEQLIAALPRHYTPDQFTVIVRTAINKNPKLAECDQSSFLAAMLTAAQMGLAPDGRNGHLIPRWNKKTGKMEATFQPDYKGLVKLVRMNENVSDVYAEPVHENDEFQIKKGLHRDLIHEVNIRQPRGEFLGAYAVISYKDGTSSFDFMSFEEIEAIRKRSQSPDYGPWQTDYSEMAKKTVIKRLLKLADLSPETAERIAHDPETPTITITQAPSPEPQKAPLPAAARPQLPEPSATSQDDNDWQPAEVVAERTTDGPQNDAEAAPEPQAPKKSAKKGSLLSKEQPQQGASPLDQIRAKLADGGKSEADLLKICVAENWIKSGESLEDLSGQVVANILKFWDEIEGELNK